MLKRLLVAVCLFATIAAPAALAQSYPSGPVRIIHGFGPGGNADTMSRIIAEPLSQRFNQPFVVDPKPGAGGNVASDFVSKAPADGSVLQLMVGGHAVSGALYRTLKFDVVKDFTFISRISAFPFFIATRKGSYKDIQALIAAGKEGKRIKFGSAGVGTTQHLTGELLGQKTGASFLHIPYKGDAGAVTALLGGEVDMIVSAGTSVLSQARAGALDLLAVSWNQPWSETPDVPTIDQTVAPGFNVFSWVGLGAPAGLPAEITKTLNTAVNEILADPAILQRISALGGVPGGSTPDAFTKLVSDQVGEWNKVIDAAGIERK